MAFALTIGISLVLVVLTLVGYMRDLRRSLLALLGTLVGAILVNFWGAQWGARLASQLVAGNLQRTTLWVSCLVFLWSALVVGYGGGVLLARAKDRPVGQRMVGALLGLLNGILIVGFLLRYATAQQEDFAERVRGDLLANGINTGLPWLFLGAALAITLMAAVRGLLGLVGRRAPRPAAPQPAAPASAKPAGAPAPAPAPGNASAPDRRVGAHDILGKIDDAAKR